MVGAPFVGADAPDDPAAGYASEEEEVIMAGLGPGD